MGFGKNLGNNPANFAKTSGTVNRSGVPVKAIKVTTSVATLPPRKYAATWRPPR